MKTKITKHTALWTTVALAGLVSTVIYAGKATTPKVNVRSKGKRNSVTKTVKKSAPVRIGDESAAMKSILASTTGLQPKVLKLGLNGYKWAIQHGHVKKHFLTIVDFSIPSKDKRMWIINLKTDKVVMKTLVANGKGSGLYKGTRFSNRHGSLESSLGIYVTGVHYYGNDGLSLHVHGLQPGINSAAYSRTIEFHGAWYVSPAFAKAHGRVGRSWGCFALDKAILPKVVKTIENGSVVFAYANGFSQDYTPYENS